MASVHAYDINIGKHYQQLMFSFFSGLALLPRLWYTSRTALVFPLVRLYSVKKHAENYKYVLEIVVSLALRIVRKPGENVLRDCYYRSAPRCLALTDTGKGK